MPNFDKNRIFNESPSKVIHREYEALKKDFTKLNAIKYKSFYESLSLSDIIGNSRYIFSEPYRGMEFYKTLMENAVLPIQAMQNECEKVSQYIQENADKMSDIQKSEYQALLEGLNQKAKSRKFSASLYESTMENPDAIWAVYDDLYEYTRSNGEHNPIRVMELFEDTDMNLIDVMNIALHTPELHATAYTYLEQCFVESPETPEDYHINAYVTNVLSRMMKDAYISEAVDALPNMNLRFMIQGMSGVTGNDMIDNIVTEKVSAYQSFHASADSLVNSFFEDEYSEAMESVNDEVKMNRLNCRLAVMETASAFLALDAMHGDSGMIDPIVEQLCIESSTIEKIPQDYMGQLTVLTECVNALRNELDVLEEKYFTSDGEPNAVIARSIGANHHTRDEFHYTPKKPPLKPEPEAKDDGEDGDDEDDEAYQRKLAEKKRKATERYANMEIDDREFRSLTESVLGDKFLKNFKGKTEKVIVERDLKFNNSPNFKALYEHWDFAVITNQKQYTETALKIAKTVYGEIHKIPRFTLVTGKAFNSEYNLTKHRYGDDVVILTLPINMFSRDKLVYFKKLLHARYFTDVVDNDVRREMAAVKGYTPPKYVSMKNINTAKKFIASNGKDVVKESVSHTIPHELYEAENADNIRPTKKPFMQRVQHKAQDLNVKAKLAMAKGKANMQDAKGALKAIARIPGNITSSIKGVINSWEEADDNKRKEYILKPGYRKKYLRALGMAVQHGVAFMINPLLNIVLAISQAISRHKDIRIRNEFARELKAEIEVVNAKIEDAANDPDKNVRYKLIRIREKLNAELARVSTNAKYI